MSAHFDEKELENLREQFVQEYCKTKGWKATDLTPTQLLEISTKPEYKNPVLLKS